ncbi:hypothetical protein VCHC19A1_0756, partial [Vibrio cholerae HC-19A1]|jgi:hypothetical protein
MSA